MRFLVSVLIPQHSVLSPKDLLFHNPGIRMFFYPLLPFGVLGGKFGQPSFKIHALDAHQPFVVRIPQRSSLTIVQNKGAVIGPAGRYQG